MNATGPETLLREQEAVARVADEVLPRHAHVFVVDLGVAGGTTVGDVLRRKSGELPPISQQTVVLPAPSGPVMSSICVSPSMVSAAHGPVLSLSDP